MRARLATGVLRHAGKAASAAAIASSTVALLASATCLTTFPVAGLKTSWRRPWSATLLPLMKWPTISGVSTVSMPVIASVLNM